MKTLVVEDDSTCSEFIRALLEEFGEVSVVDNGAEALTLFANESFDLVCLDIGLPHPINGTDVLTYMRALETHRGIALGSGAKIVMTTGSKDSKTVMGAFRKSCDGYVVKPLMADQFFNTLKDLGVI